MSATITDGRTRSSADPRVGDFDPNALGNLFRGDRDSPAVRRELD
jgi:hypothetical protein